MHASCHHAPAPAPAPHHTPPTDAHAVTSMPDSAKVKASSAVSWVVLPAKPSATVTLMVGLARGLPGGTTTVTESPGPRGGGEEGVGG